MKLYGAIEAGGTKFVCGIGTAEGRILDRISLPTLTPEETMGAVLDYFRDKSVTALGVASFGPLDRNADSPTYGYITSTPKPHWGDYNMLGALRQELSVPMAFDTDVNGAALGEATWGAARGLASCLYITVGTGIGAGAMSNGQLISGFTHPEMGHLPVRRHPDDPFAGRCPYHQDCLEGMAAGPAIEERWNIKGSELGPDHPAWNIEAYYLAQALMSYILVLMPEKIIMGGGVMKQGQLFPLIRRHLTEMLNGYVVHPNLGDRLESFIVPPGLGDNAGLSGAVALALQAAGEQAQ